MTVVRAIRCRYAALDELVTDEVAVVDGWLAPAEREAWQCLRAPERRRGWLAGRVLAKRLLMEYLRDAFGQIVAAGDIQIRSRSSSTGLGQRPRVEVSGRALDCTLSIAHSPRGALVALSGDASLSPGVDLVCPEECQGERLAWCFTPAERRWLATAPAHSLACERLWAMKEAVFKACQRGESFAPQRIEVIAEGDARGVAPGVQSLQCWRIDAQVAALAVAAPHRAPIHSNHALHC